MAEIVKSEVTAEDLKMINSYAKAELKAEDVYTFKIACCDNQVDRQFEKFTDKALSQMAELFVGKTIIKDHDPETDNQVARIFKTNVDDDGIGNKRLIVYVYTPITDKTKDFISDIETGIKKEVSVGFGLGKMTCSICGKDFYSCNHIKSKMYDGKQCYGIIDDVKDAYELSFVAVPAQRNAGVIKSFKSIQQPATEKPKSADNDEKIKKLQVRLRLAETENLNFESEEN